MTFAILNLIFILLGLGLAVSARLWFPDVPELGMVAGFLIGLGMKRLGDERKDLMPLPPPGGDAR